MELYQLKTFLAVAEEGHLTRAAERLFISQPAVSAHIKALEEQLGLKLFKRTSKGVRLTDHGKAVREEARRVIECVAALNNKAHMLRGEFAGAVRIGLNTASTFLRVAPFISRLKKKYPKIEFELRKGLSGDIIKDLKNGRLDAGFVFGEWESKQLEFVFLRSSKLRVAAPVEWKDRIKGKDWKDIARLPWVLTPRGCSFRRFEDRTFARIGLKPTDVIIAEDESLTHELVAAGDGLSLFKEEEALKAEKAGDVAVWDGDTIEIKLSFAYPTARKDDELIKRVVEEVKEVWNIGDGKKS